MATLEKAEVKILTATSIGADIEDLLEAAQRAEYNAEGGKLALGQAYKAVLSLSEHLKKDLEEGKIDLKELSDPDKLVAYVRKWIARAANLVENLQMSQQTTQISSAGMVAAYKRSMDIPLKVCESERKKMEAVVAALEQEAAGKGDEDLDLRDQTRARPRSRATGAHPGNPLGSRRSAKKASKSANGASRNPVAKKAAKKAAKKKRRGRG